MTPRFFHAISDRHAKRIAAEHEHRDFMLAQIVEMVANCGNLQWSRPRQWREFMPRFERSHKPKRRRAALTAKEQRHFDDSMARAMRQAVHCQNAGNGKQHAN